MSMNSEKMGFFKMQNASLGNYYGEISKALLNREDRISLENSALVTNDVISAIMLDLPELFWFEGKWKMIEYEGQRHIVPVYNMKKEEIGIAKEILYDRCVEIENLYKNASDYEIVKGIYQWIIQNVKYEIGLFDNGQTVYDALVKRKAVCKGIAKTYQLLLGRFNIFSTLVIGSIDGKARHIWNVVRLNEKYYNVDVCMGYKQFDFLYEECQRGNSERGLLISDEKMKRTHMWLKNYPYRIECDE